MFGTQVFTRSIKYALEIKTICWAQQLFLKIVPFVLRDQTLMITSHYVLATLQLFLVRADALDKSKASTFP